MYAANGARRQSVNPSADVWNHDSRVNQIFKRVYTSDGGTAERAHVKVICAPGGPVPPYPVQAWMGPLHTDVFN